MDTAVEEQKKDYSMSFTNPLQSLSIETDPSSDAETCWSASNWVMQTLHLSPAVTCLASSLQLLGLAAANLHYHLPPSAHPWL